MFPVLHWPAAISQNVQSLNVPVQSWLTGLCKWNAVEILTHTLGQGCYIKFVYIKLYWIVLIFTSKQYTYSSFIYGFKLLNCICAFRTWRDYVYWRPIKLWDRIRLQIERVAHSSCVSCGTGFWWNKHHWMVKYFPKVSVKKGFKHDKNIDVLYRRFWICHTWTICFDRNDHGPLFPILLAFPAHHHPVDSSKSINWTSYMILPSLHWLLHTHELLTFDYS